MTVTLTVAVASLSSVIVKVSLPSVAASATIGKVIVAALLVTVVVPVRPPVISAAST